MQSIKRIKWKNRAILMFAIISLAFVSCNMRYVREKDCDLEKMAVWGNVVKIESIVQSTIPLTELYHDNFDPRYSISSHIGNTSISFDRHGNIKHSSGFNMDGEIIFHKVKFTPPQKPGVAPVVVLSPNISQEIDRVENTQDDSGKIVKAKYFSKNDLIWTQNVYYNKNGFIDYITKEYHQLKIELDSFSISFADTTRYEYLAYDKMNNWIEAEVAYTGVLQKHNHSYRVKRQISYFGEQSKSPLIKDLKEYNRATYQATDNFKNIRLAHYGSMDIPKYMNIKSKDDVQEVLDYMSSNHPLSIEISNKYIYMSEYSGRDSFASISTNITFDNDKVGYNDLSPNDLQYDKDVNEYFQDFYTEQLASSNIYILKWLPYEFVTVSGKRALKLRYYRYGTGGPIPVYCECYTIPMLDGYTLGISFSFQSSSDLKFRKDFERSMQSIQFY